MKKIVMRSLIVIMLTLVELSMIGCPKPTDDPIDDPVVPTKVIEQKYRGIWLNDDNPDTWCFVLTENRVIERFPAGTVPDLNNWEAWTDTYFDGTDTRIRLRIKNPSETTLGFFITDTKLGISGILYTKQ